jgi:predicted RNase H-like nuclease (RuvC/YqgF family)
MFLKRTDAGADNSDDIMDYEDYKELRKEIKFLKKQIASQEKRIISLERSVPALKEFVSEQSRANKIYIESIERMKNDVDVMKKGDI